jgi:hypothetical protein
MRTIVLAHATPDKDRAQMLAARLSRSGVATQLTDMSKTGARALRAAIKANWTLLLWSRAAARLPDRPPRSIG